MNVLTLVEILKTFVLTSVLFVWIVRYDNIVIEFKQYGLPDWLRDFVGILKISFVVMLLNGDSSIVILGSAGIVVLMLAALFTHFKIKNPVGKMVPSFVLMSFSLAILLMTL